MADKILNFPWEVVNNRVAKIGVGAYLTATADTAVTTAYTRLLGTFTNVEMVGFEFDVTSGKLMYNPEDGEARTVLLNFTGEVKCPSVNDVASVAIELTRDAVSEIVAGTNVDVTCRTANSPYPFCKVYPLALEVGDLIEIQAKGDSSFTLTMDEFATTLTKFY